LKVGDAISGHLVFGHVDGTVKVFYIPNRIMRGEKQNDLYENMLVQPDWPWVYPEYKLKLKIPMSQIESIEIDPSQRMADIYRDNNVYPKVSDHIFDGGTK